MPNPIDLAKPDFENVINHLDRELRGIRSGRANAAILDNVRVEAYGGSVMDLKSLSTISVPDARTIQIEPWDAGILKDIEKGIIAANIGLNPVIQGKVVRLSLPPMTEENRKDTVKIVHQKGEQSKIGMRGVRDTVREAILKSEKEKVINEDERYRQLDLLDKAISEWNQKIEALIKEKEEEVLSI